MLRGEKDTSKLCQNIVRYSLWHYALSLREMPLEHLTQLAESNHALPDDYKPGDYVHQLVMASACRLNVTIGCLPACIKEGQKLHTKFGTTGTQCRIRSDYLWSACNDSWPILKFQTLCGVLAGIGRDGPRRLNHRMIQALGAGHNSPKGLKDSDILPKSSVRYWLDQLWYKNMFQFCKRGHERWYSIGLAGDASLAEAVKAIPVKAPKKSVIDVDAI